MLDYFLDEVRFRNRNSFIYYTKNLDLSFLVILLLGKLFLTSSCIGLIFLVELSPAFLGAIVGALVYNLIFWF